MNPDDLHTFDGHLSPLEHLAPSTGGVAQIITGPEKGFVAIVGDRAGLIRLALAILRYALDARCEKGRFKAKAKALDGFFAAPSLTRDLFIQLDETPSDQRKRTGERHSTTNLVARLLFKKQKGQ